MHVQLSVHGFTSDWLSQIAEGAITFFENRRIPRSTSILESPSWIWTGLFGLGKVLASATGSLVALLTQLLVGGGGGIAYSSSWIWIYPIIGSYPLENN